MNRGRLALYFVEPYKIAVRQEAMLEPGPGQVLVKSILLAISAGTELLVYRGQAPDIMPADETIRALSGSFSYPMKYGYAALGEVVETGPGVDVGLAGRLVFVFHPHESHFVADLGELIIVPDDISPEDAVFLANMESAVGFIMDGKPLIGEQVAVFGQGVVGLLTTAALAQMPLGNLVAFDCYEKRRKASLEVGSRASLDATQPDIVEHAKCLLEAEAYSGADLTYELSGSPEALKQAIAVTGFSGRVVIGSWYGRRRAELDLGGHFHRSKIRLISSQVSSLSPELTGRWTKVRRFNVCWDMLRKIRPNKFITHSFPLDQAQQAYRVLDESPGEAIQVVLTIP